MPSATSATYYDAIGFLAGADAIDSKDGIALANIPLPVLSKDQRAWYRPSPNPVGRASFTRPPFVFSKRDNATETTTMPKAKRAHTTKHDDKVERLKAARDQLKQEKEEEQRRQEEEGEPDDEEERPEVEEEKDEISPPPFEYPPPAPPGYNDTSGIVNHPYLSHAPPHSAGSDTSYTMAYTTAGLPPHLTNAPLSDYTGVAPTAAAAATPAGATPGSATAPMARSTPHQDAATAQQQTPGSIPGLNHPAANAGASPMGASTPTAMRPQQPRPMQRPPPTNTRQSTAQPPNPNIQYKTEECPICGRHFKGPKASTHKQQHIRRLHPEDYIPKRGGKKRVVVDPQQQSPQPYPQQSINAAHVLNTPPPGVQHPPPQHYDHTPQQQQQQQQEDISKSLLTSLAHAAANPNAY